MRAIKNVLFNREVDFSDWLSNNLHKLDSFINSTLKKIGTEEPIDGKIVDILAEDKEGKIVAIENQFGLSNHTHLGQLLSYCIGLKKEKKEVKNGIWIAEKFHSIHIAVINWLNDTRSGITYIPISVVNPETNQMEELDKLEFKKPIIFNEAQVGDILPALNHDYVEVDDNLKRLMDEYDEEKSKTKPISKSIRNGQITGSFIRWVYNKNENLYKTYFASEDKAKVGVILPALNHDYVEVDDNLKKLMDEYDEEKGKTKPISKSIRNGQITGSFIFWVYNKNENLYKTYFASEDKAKIGVILPALNHDYVKIDDNLKKLMNEYDEEKGKTKPISKSIRNGQITGSFIRWIYNKNENLYKTYFASEKKPQE